MNVLLVSLFFMLGCSTGAVRLRVACGFDGAQSIRRTVLSVAPDESWNSTVSRVQERCPSNQTSYLVDLDGAEVRSVDETGPGEETVVLFRASTAREGALLAHMPGGSQAAQGPGRMSRRRWAKQIIQNEAAYGLSLWRQDPDGPTQVGHMVPFQQASLDVEPPREVEFLATQEGATEVVWRFSVRAYTRWHRHFNESTLAVMELEAPRWEHRRDKFIARYHNDTGRVWEGFYPRPPPLWPFLSTTILGQRHQRSSAVGFHGPCDSGPAEALCPPAGNVSVVVEAEVLCSSPQLLQLHRIISDSEAEYIRAEAIRLGMVLSRTEDSGQQALRNSSTAWIHRNHSSVIDAIYRRIAEVMQLPESKLWPGAAAEMLQVVRYRPGEGYNSHTDYGGNLPHDRFLTVLLYLSDAPQQGGRTEFSRTERCQPSLGQVPRLHAPKGSALAFYSVLPDGNFDTHSKHSAGPVESRNDEKWVCNLWVWDPGRKSNSMDFL